MIKGFTMKLYEGQEVEYEKRHNLLWPEMKEILNSIGMVEKITQFFWIPIH